MTHRIEIYGDRGAGKTTMLQDLIWLRLEDPDVSGLRSKNSNDGSNRTAG